MIRKQDSPARDKLRVIFELPASLWAERVSVVADFNHWDSEATPLHQDRDGIWRTIIDLPIGRRYAFRYLIDGCWSTDAHADGVALGRGGLHDSVVCTDLPICRPDPALGQGMIHEASPCLPDLLSGSFPAFGISDHGEVHSARGQLGCPDPSTPSTIWT